MSYTFETLLFGLTVSVEGCFTPAEPETLNDPGWIAEFEINIIKHKGEEVEIDQIPGYIIKDIEQAAFDSATDEVGEQ